MEECEICGKPTSILYTVALEGAHVMVCEKCSQGKAVIDKIDLGGKGADRKEQYKPSRELPQEEEIVDNYGTLIRKSREAMGLPLKVLAERIAEKESTMLRVEEQKTLPSTMLTKKIEKELGIKLTTRPEPRASGGSFGKTGPITLGDAAFKKAKAAHEESEE